MDINVAELVRHSGEIILIDTIIEVDDESLHAETTVRNDGLFNTGPEDVPSFIAVEYMAQSIAAWAGYRGRHEGKPANPGLLLGTRDFTASIPMLPVGSTVQIQVNLVMEMASGLAVFDAQVSNDELTISSRLSVLTVYSLDDINL